MSDLPIITTNSDIKQLLLTNQIELIPVQKSSFHAAEIRTQFSEIKIAKDDSISEKVTCNSCHKLYKVYNIVRGKKTNTNGISTLKRHILSCPSKTKNQIKPFLKQKTQILIPKTQQDTLNKELLKMIISTGSSFQSCGNPSLAGLINYTMQLSRLHNITDITDYLPKRRKLKVITSEEVEEFKELLKSTISGGHFNKDICISLDIATENINKILYIGMIFYFIKVTIIHLGSEPAC